MKDAREYRIGNPARGYRARPVSVSMRVASQINAQSEISFCK